MRSKYKIGQEVSFLIGNLEVFTLSRGRIVKIKRWVHKKSEYYIEFLETCYDPFNNTKKIVNKCAKVKENRIISLIDEIVEPPVDYKINQNQRIKVKVPIDSIRKAYSRTLDPEAIRDLIANKVDAQGYFHTQLWEFMKRFGNQIKYTSSPLQDGCIILDNQK